MNLTPKALTRWVWLPGMAAIDRAGTRWRICEGANGHLYAVGEPSGYIGGWLLIAPLIEAVPDLTDPVTADSLPRVVRAAWGVEDAYCVRDILHNPDQRWVVIVWTEGGRLVFEAPTVTEAWIKALEAAP